MCAVARGTPRVETVHAHSGGQNLVDLEGL